MTTEKFSNSAQTILASGMTNSQTSLVVQAATVFPSSGNFRIIVDSEIMLVTGVSGTTFTVSRGQETTAAAAHSVGASVTHILTAQSILTAITDRIGVLGSVTPTTSLPGDVAATGVAGTAATGDHRHGREPYSVGSKSTTPEAHGAVGDGKIVNDVTTTSGTPNISSGSALFTAGDVGKSITIISSSGVVLVPGTTILTFTSSTAIVLNANASASTTGSRAVYGTDDGTALNAAATAIAPGGRVYYDDKIYRTTIPVVIQPETSHIGTRDSYDIYQNQWKWEGGTLLSAPVGTDIMTFTNNADTHCAASIRGFELLDGEAQLKGITDVDSVIIERIFCNGAFKWGIQVSDDVDGWVVRDCTIASTWPSGSDRDATIGIGGRDSSHGSVYNSTFENISMDDGSVGYGVRLHLDASNTWINTSVTGDSIQGFLATQSSNSTFVGCSWDVWATGGGSAVAASHYGSQIGTVDLTNISTSNAPAKVYFFGCGINTIIDPHDAFDDEHPDAASRSRLITSRYAGRHFGQRFGFVFTSPASVDGMTQGTHAPSRLQIRKSVLSVTSTNEVIFYEDHSDLMSNGNSWDFRALVMLPPQPSTGTLSLLVTDNTGPDTKTKSAELRLSTDGTLKLFYETTIRGTATGAYIPGLWIWLSLYFDGSAFWGRYSYDGSQYQYPVTYAVPSPPADVSTFIRTALDFNPTAAAGPIYGSVDYFEIYQGGGFDEFNGP